MKTVVVVSDTHMPFMASDLPAAFVSALKSCDICIHAGDIVENKILTAIGRLAPRVVAVQGNMDDAVIKKKLPLKTVINIDGVTFGVTHATGTPHDITERVLSIFKDDLPSVCVFGHSHRPYNKKHGQTLLFNPGSLTDYLYTDTNSYGIIKIENGKIISHDIITL